MNRKLIVNSLVSIFGFVLFAILLKLGFWQLQRAQYKRELISQFHQRSKAAPMMLATVMKNASEWQYQHVSIVGTFDNQHSFLLDNQFHQHQIGYQVITPLLLAANQASVLVNRGWIAAGTSRNVLPVIEPVMGSMQLQGMVYRPLKPMLVLKQIPLAKNVWPSRIQRLDFTEMQQTLGYPIQAFTILLDSNQAHGFIREWKPVIIPPEKHIAYAVQWFALAATLMIIILVMFYRMITHRNGEQHASKPIPTPAQ